MKAAVYYENGGPSVLRYEDVPDPRCPPDGVVIAVEVVSLEGGDTLHRAMTPLVDRPHIVGYQCAGTVVQVGPEVKDRRLGDRVVAVMPYGSHAERAAVRASSTWLVGPAVDLVAVGSVPVAFGSAHEALFALGQLARGQRVLVHAGAGGVGLAAIQLARAAGAEVITTASSEEKLARLRDLGAAHGVNYKQGSWSEAVRQIVGPSGVDLVIDPVGGKTLEESLVCLAYRGKIVHLGFAGRELATFNPVSLWTKNATLVGLSLTSAMRQEPARVHEVIAECIQRVASGQLRAIVDRRFSLAEAAQAHAYVESRAAFGRVVMIP